MKKIIIAQIYEAFIEDDDCKVDIDEIVEECVSTFEGTLCFCGLDFEKDDTIVAEKNMNIIADGMYYVKSC